MSKVELAYSLGISVQELSFLYGLSGILSGFLVSVFLIKTLQY